MSLKRYAPAGIVPGLRRLSFLRRLVVSALLPAMTLSTNPVLANPRGGSVVHGNVKIGSGAGGNLQIRQNSNSAIINWESFSIDAGELTQFRQPDSNAAVLNRVTGGDPSAIHGALKANGKVFVINPNGILVGPGGTIDVHGLVLSTLDVDNGEFLAGGDMTFTGVGENVTNMGRINGIGGDVFLIGRTVRNSGAISASSGTVGLAAGEEVLLTAQGNTGERLFVRAKGAGVSGTGILNDGTIEGAAVELKAHGNLFALAINNKGSIRATGAVNSGGKVFLRGPGGSVSNSGSIQATSSGVGNGGRTIIEAAYARVDGLIRSNDGHVRITGTDEVELGGSVDVSSSHGVGGDVVVEGRAIAVGSTGMVDASGRSGGGRVRIGGGFQGSDAEVENAERVLINDGATLRANARESGRGGQLIAWSDGDTFFEGTISATGMTGGGFVEVSGRDRLGFHGAVSTLSADGTAGTLLLDPTNGTVSSAAANTGGSPFNINAANLVTALGSNHVVISTPAAGPDPGHLTFQNAVIWNSDFSLSTLAHGDVTFLASVQNGGAGAINVVAGWDGLTGLPGTSPLASPGSMTVADFISNPGSFGNASGSVRLGDGVQGAQVAVGSRLGDTTVLGYDVRLTAGTASDRAVQLGYNPVQGALAAAAGGNVAVHALNDVILTGGQNGTGGQVGTGLRNHAKIGHGGRNATENGFNHAGNIGIYSGLGGAGTTGDILGSAGTNLDGFVQVGHGGTGGATASGSFTGDITMVAGEAGRVEFVGGIGRRAFVQVGHGGHDVDAGILVAGASGFHSGTVGISAGTDVIFTAGIGSTLNFNTDSRAHALVGHGGYASEARSAVQGHTGDITVEAGRGSVSGAVNFRAGDLDDNFAQIGHGGAASTSAANGHRGDLSVSALAGVSFLAGTGQTFRTTQDGRLFAQIGHGGYNSGVANNAVPPAGSLNGHSGDIGVTTTGGDLRFYGGSTALGSAGDGLGRLHFVQVGHGGHGSPGAHHGSITLEAAAGGVDFRAGTSTDDATDGTRNFALLGHGGHSATRGTFGRAGDVFSVTAGGNITFTAGGSASGGRAFAQLGSGGYDADMSPELTPGNGGNIADIIVRSTGGDIVFTATGGGGNYVQLGHGGIATSGDQTGDISVMADAGAVRFLGGTATDAYALLGHGGRSSDGNRTGDIEVVSRQAILFQGGTGTRAFTQLGHGGRPGPAAVPVDGMTFNGNSSGDILVRSFEGGIDFRWAATTTDPGSLSFVQLGHGGSYAVGDHSGDIRVLAEGNILFQNSTAATTTRLNNYVQLGHGGIFAAGNHSGGVTVLSNNGTITFRGGSRGGGDRYAQLGHGGLGAAGNHRGDLSVLANGAILFSSLGVNTSAQRSYMQLGHGGHNADSLPGHSGDIAVGSRTGTISFLAAPDGSAESYAQLGHGGFDAAGGHNGDIVVRSGNQIVVTAGTVAAPVIGGVGNSYAQIGHGGGKATGTTDPAADLSGAIMVSAQVAGDFSDLGDFDGDTFPDTITFTSGASATALQFTGGVANTLDQYALLGHGGAGNTGNHSGVIDVTARRSISFLGGAGTRGFAQLGHGGHGAAAATGHRGNVTVRATGEGAVTANQVFTPGVGLESYAQLGHGGFGATGSHAGNIRAIANSALTLNANSGTIAGGYRAYAQIGHGGYGAAGSHGGDVTVLANLGAIAFTGGRATSATVDGIADERYTQIGHGGLLAKGDHEGDIAVLANTGITFLGGTGATRSYSQIGHGGHEADAVTGHSGRIAVASRTGAISFTSGAGTSVESYVQLGHGGMRASGDHGGDIVVRAGNNLVLSASAGSDTVIPDPVDPINNPPTRLNHSGYAQIGHGGLESGGERSGSITVSSQIAGDYTDIGDFDDDGLADTVTIAAGTSTEGLLINGGTDAVTGATDAYAQIGHGGRLARGTNAGDIEVDALRQIRVVAGQIGQRTYVQIGHGGSEAAPVTGGPAGNANEGDIFVASRTGLVDFRWTAETTVTSHGTYAQLGHGGQITDPLISGVNAGGNNDGDIRVIAGTNLLFRSTTGGTTAAGTTSQGNYVQLGHGGLRWTGNHAGNISVQSGAAGTTGTIGFTAGNNNNSHGDGVSEGGTDRYAQLGHGGNFAVGQHSGDIEVVSRGNLTFLAGRNPRSYAQLGHGGILAGAGGNSGDIRVASQTGGIDFRYSVDGTSTTATTDTPGISSYAQLGHGGYDNIGSNRGNIVVHAGGNLLIRGIRGNFPVNHLGNYAQIGHGGFRAEGNHSGSITVTAGTGGSIADLFDLDNDGTRDALDFTSNGVGTLQLLSGGGATDRYVQIGHGGRLARGDHGAVDPAGNALDTISVTALGTVTVTSRGGTRGYAQIGNGGHDADLEVNPRGAAANLAVTSTGGSVLFTGSTGDSASAHLGNGGYTTSGNHRGSITVAAAAEVNFIAAQSLTGTTGNAYVQLGHGGRGAVGNHSGDVIVRAGTGGVTGSVNFRGGMASERYAQLGHGGRSANGDHRGDITVESWGGVNFQGGDFRAFTNTSSPNVATAAINGDGAAGLKLPTTAYINPGSLTITLASPVAPEYGTIRDDGKGNLLDVNGAVVGSINYANADVAFLLPVASGGTATSTYRESNFSRTYAQLGHGGSDTTAVIGSSGDIRVAAGLGGVTGDVVFTAGPSNESYALLGHGGRAGRGDHSGDIFVDGLGEIRFTGNQGFRNFAQLGHGGWDSDLNTVGSTDRGSSGDILVNTCGLIASQGGITFTAGTGEESYVQLGHGGYGTRGAASGNLAGLNRIDVRGGGDIVFLSGDGSGFGDDTTLRIGNGRRAYAQLGHGGYDSDAHNVDAEGLDGLGHDADIFVNAAGSLRFEAAALVSDPFGVTNGPIAGDFRNYVQLGHGGLAASGDHRGDISVQTGGGVEFRSGGVAATATANTTHDSYAQLGHGGFQSPGYGGNDTLSFTGDIRVIAATGDLRFVGGNSVDAYVQLGHGGRDAHGGAIGDIRVEANAGRIEFLAGERAQHYAQLGHGGYTARGDRVGSISVDALSDIIFTGGAAAQTYAHLGHGGYDADNPNPGYYPDNDPLTLQRGPTADERVGNIGAISVESRDGNIGFTTGSANNSYAQLGHGGSFNDGDHGGDILVRADADRSNAGSGGRITFLADTAGTAHYAQLGHGGYRASGGNAGSITVEAGADITFTGGTTSNYVQIGHGGRNDHRLTRSGSSPNFTQANDNDRYYPGTHTGAITVGSGGDISFTAGIGTGAFGQIGHGGYRNAAEAGEGHGGAIEVAGGGEIRFIGQSGTSAYVQIGHGGYEAFGNHGYASVRAEAGLGATSRGGSAFLANGALAPGSVRVTVDPAGTGAGTAVFTDDGRGNLIDPGDVLGLGAGTIVGTVHYATGEVTVTGNLNAANDDVAVAYLHGGSDILVDGGAGITFVGGSGSTAYAQIGHGGLASSFADARNVQPEESSPAANTSTTTFHLNTPLANPVGTSGGITVLAGTGMTVNPAAGLAFSTGNGNDSYAQIGNGGRNARGDHHGEIFVNAAGDVAFSAFAGGAATQTQTSGTLNNLTTNGSGTFTLSQTANLLRDNSFFITYANPLPGFSGEVRSDAYGRLFDGTTEVGTISTGGVITFTVAVSSEAPAASVTYDHFNTGLRTYAQIGHGGHDADFPTALTPGDSGNLGNITVRSANGAIAFAAGSRSESYAQIGHGGYTTNGDHSGNIIVDALGAGGVITFAAGTRVESYAQIGHGGRSGRGDFGRIDVDGDGTADGDITVAARGAVRFSSGIGGQTYSQIGHGGYDSDATTAAGIPGSQGDIAVRSLAGDILFSSVGSVGANAYSQIGHGGMVTNGDFSGDVSVVASGGEVRFTAGEANDRYAQLGHGGRQAKGAHTGDIEVLGADGVYFTGGASSTVTAESNVSLYTAATGGGGATATLANTAGLDLSSFTIAVADPVLPEHALLTTNATGQLFDGNGVQVGSISGGGVVTFTTAVAKAGSGSISVAYDHANSARNYAQLGNGGHDADATGTVAGVTGQRGDIRVAATAGDVVFSSGQGQESYSQLGHGGFGTAGDHSGDLVVRAGGNVDFIAGLNVATATGMTASRVNNYAQLGHGGMSASGNHLGNVTVSAGTSGSFNDVAPGPLAFTAGAIGRVNFLGGMASDTYVHLGHGGRSIANSSLTGDISVTALGDVLLQSGVGGNAYAQIGLGGYGADNTGGNHTGDVLVRSTGGSVLLDANNGAGANAYVQIGSGGLVKGTGTIRGSSPVSTIVKAAGIVSLSGGAGTNRYAQIGMGGSGTDGDKIDAGVGVTAGSVLLNAGTGGAAYAHIGGGGGLTNGSNASTGNVTGDVSVTATTGGISLNGAPSGSRNYAQIGHGGTSATGDYLGDIHLVSAGGLSLNGGGVATAHALVGHGGLTTGVTTRTVGLRQGNILARVGGATTVVDNTSLGFIGHLGTTGVSGASRLALVTGQLNLSASSLAVTGMISNMIPAGSVEIGVTNGDLRFHGAVPVINSPHHIDLFSGNNVNFEVSLQNAGSAEVNVVGGWDAMTGLDESIVTTYPAIVALSLDVAQVAANPASSAQNNGIVSVGNGAQTAAISVGSRAGTTSVLAYGIEVVGGTGGNNRRAQIGYFAAAPGAATGDLRMRAGAGDVRVSGGGNQGSSAQIGHGGLGSLAGAVSGSIIVSGSGTGDLLLQGGGGSSAYAQVGHGGVGFSGTQSGNFDLSSFINVSLTGGEGSNTYAQIGLGGVGSAGAKTGDLSLVAENVTLTGGTGATANSKIGHGGRIGAGDITGDLLVGSLVGDLILRGGSGSFTSAQIGHGGANHNGSVIDAQVNVVSAADLEIRGGSGLQSTARIGHGDGIATGAVFSGDVLVDAADDLRVLGGSGGSAFSQIGHGGFSASAAMSGGIVVTAGSDLELTSQAPLNGAYAKIGHGDDMRGSLSFFGGSGDRSGAIGVSAGRGIRLSGGMIGHVNETSGATALSGVTQIGVSRDNPSDPSAGSLIADAASRFHGEDELRFYLPHRENSQIAAGAVLNGAVWRGASTDPAPVQRIDEYTVNIIGNPGSTPNEHGNVFGTGPAPVNAAGFAFYYDTILMGPAPFVPTPPSPPTPPAPPLPPVPPAPDFPSFFPDDQTTDDWQREQEGVFSGPGQSNFYYEGFSEDGFFGENVFAPGSDVDLSADEEEMMRRHLRLLGIEVSE